MTPAETRAEMLAALAAAERSRDTHRLAAEADDETVRRLQRVLAETAITVPPLPAPEWVSVADAARACGLTKEAAAQRARRGVNAGIAEKRGGRWYLRLDRMPPARGQRPL